MFTNRLKGRPGEGGGGRGNDREREEEGEEQRMKEKAFGRVMPKGTNRTSEGFSTGAG